MSKNDVLEEIKKGILDELYDRKNEYVHIQISSEDVTIEELFEEKTQIAGEGYILTNLFHALQGVTIGGEESTAIFSNVKGNVDTENDLVFKTIGGRNITANKITWTDEYMIFPYIIESAKFIPAFYDKEMEKDILNFDINLDDLEAGKDRNQKLTYRIAKGYIKYPNVAEYLCDFYEDLYYREFENKHILEYNKSWYEFHRPRTPQILSVPKIVCRRLMKEPSFAIDVDGYLPIDSVIILIPKELFNNLLKDLEKVTENEISILNGYYYVISFLNSEMFKKYLERKRAKKRGGYPIVSEKMLSQFIIPLPSHLDKDELLERIKTLKIQDSKSITMKDSMQYKKSSIYDPIIDAFIERQDDIVEVTVKGMTTNYLTTQLNKRIKARDLQDKITVSVINGVLYLEKI